MKWKIFKPTFTKILLFILFMLFIPFLIPHGFQCITTPCPQPSVQSIFTYILSNFGPIVGIKYLNLIFGCIISYIVSCMITLGLNKSKTHLIS